MVTAVMPKGNAKAFEDFYNPKVGCSPGREMARAD